jgi:Type II secretion system (T2SS), protein E, N-terminal domain
LSTPLRERPDAPLGTLIFRAGLLPAETIESALQESSRTGKRLGEILLERNLLEEAELSRLLAGQKGLPFVTLRETGIEQDAVKLFTQDQARLYRALPYQLESGSPTVAISDPTNEVVMRNIREALDGTDVQFAVATRTELTELIMELYDPNARSNGHANGNGAYPNDASPAAETPVALAEPEVEPEPEAPVTAVAEPKPEPLPEVLPDPQPQPALAEPSPEPVLAADPAPDPVPAAEIAVPAPTPVPEVEPEPDPEPQPVAAEPEPAPLRIAPPQPVQSATQSTEPGVTTFRVVIRLSNNDRVEAAVVGDPIAAKAQAKALIRYIAGKDGTDWPYVGGRFLKPDAIVSVDLIEQSPGETA